MPSLLATTSFPALFLGTATPAHAGQSITSNPAGHVTTSIVVVSSTVAGAVTNAGTIAPGTKIIATAVSIFVDNSSIGGGIANTGIIDVHRADTPSAAVGTLLVDSTVTGDITNDGTITATHTSPGIAVGVFTLGSTLTGGVVNNGTITATEGRLALPIVVDASKLGGGITNTGTLIATSANNSAADIDVLQSAVSGLVSNGGTVIANGVNGTGISASASVFSGGITNTGTLFGSSDSINFTRQLASTTITQAAGALIGGIGGSGKDVLNVTGGALSLQPTSTVSGLANFNQTGGNVVLQVTSKPILGQFPTVKVDNLVLSHALEVAPQSGSFAPGQAITYANVFTATGTLANNVASVQVFDFFSNKVMGSLTAGNASPLSVTLTNNSGMALAPGVASGAGNFTGLTVPLGAILPAVSVTQGASVNGGIVNNGFIGNLKLPGPSKTGILVSGGSLSGPIVNTGTIAGTVAAIDVSGAIGPTTIVQSSGTITGAIKLSANTDTLTVNGGNIAGDILGAGTSGILTVDPANNANNTFTYANTIAGVAAINIAANANLALTPQGVLNISGVLTLAPTARISGNGAFRQTASGTTALQVTNNNAAGAFPTIAANAIMLSGKLQVVLTGSFPASGMQDFVKVFTASGALTNNIATNNVSVVTGGATLPAGTVVTAQLVQGGNSADVVVTEAPPPPTPKSGIVAAQTPTGFAAVTGLTRNEAAVATTLNAVLAADTKVSQALLFELLHLSAPSLPRALDALSGELHASVVTAAFEDSRLPRETILDHLSDPLAPLAITMGAYAANLTSGETPRLTPVAMRLQQPPLFALWGQGFGDRGHVSSDGNAAAISHSTGGFVLGGDSSAKSFVGGDWRFGVVGGYRISLSGATMGGLSFSRTSFEAFAGAAAIRIHQNGVTEGGGIAPLTGTAKHFDIATTSLGVRGELAFASLPVTLTSMLAWRHAYGDVVPSVLLGFQGGAQSFAAAAIPIDRDALVTKAGLNYVVTSGLAVGLSYSGQLGKRTMDNAFSGYLNLRF